MKNFEAPDFFELDELLSPEEKLVRDSVRDFVNTEIMPIIEDCHRDMRFPKELIPKLGELGVLGPQFKGYGCAGMNYTSYGIVMRELERGDSGLRSVCSVQSSLSMHPIYKFGTDKQKDKYLPKMATGEWIGCFGLTEPDHGSDPAGMKTKAIKDGNHYVLNGTKMWITSGSIAELAIVWARDERGKVIGLIVDKDTPGFSSSDIKNKFSLRASVTSELVFEDCRVPIENKLEVEGLKGPFSCLNSARYGIAWGAIGAAMACYDEALNYAKTRIQFDKPIASYQLVQSKLVYMFTEITKAQMLNYHLGRKKDDGSLIAQQVSMGKMNNVSKALEIARMTRDILGANGITDEYQCGRHMANLESVNTYEGTEDIHRLILGQHITDIPAFR